MIPDLKDFYNLSEKPKEILHDPYQSLLQDGEMAQLIKHFMPRMKTRVQILRPYEKAEWIWHPKTGNAQKKLYRWVN